MVVVHEVTVEADIDGVRSLSDETNINTVAVLPHTIRLRPVLFCDCTDSTMSCAGLTVKANGSVPLAVSVAVCWFTSLVRTAPI